MDKAREWFNEALKNGRILYSVNGTEYILYKGFKLMNKNGEYTIQDIRLTDMYTDPLDEHLQIINKNGFIRGADIISYERNLKRVESYTSAIEKLYEDIDHYHKLLDSKPAFYRKKIDNCEDSINTNMDLMFFYKSQLDQHKRKYNLK